MTEKQWYRAAHKRIGGHVHLVELTQEEVNAAFEDYDLAPMVVMTLAEFDKAIEEAEKRGRTWRGGW